MKIQDQYINKHLKQIAIDQLYDQYIQKGYRVSKSGKTKGINFDLLARKLGERIFVLVQVSSFTEDEKENLVQLTEYIKSIQSDEFKLYVAFVNPVSQKSIEFSDIDSLLTDHLFNYTPEDILELSTHSRVQDVTDVDIDKISIQDNIFIIIGNGLVSVALEFGSGSDIRNGDGYISSDSFPFSFEIVMEYDSVERKFTINEDDSKVEVDTSSYFE